MVATPLPVMAVRVVPRPEALQLAGLPLSIFWAIGSRVEVLPMMGQRPLVEMFSPLRQAVMQYPAMAVTVARVERQQRLVPLRAAVAETVVIHRAAGSKTQRILAVVPNTAIPLVVMPLL